MYVGVSQGDKFMRISIILSRLHQNLDFLGGYLGIKISSVAESLWSQTPSGPGIPSGLRTPSGSRLLQVSGLLLVSQNPNGSGFIGLLPS
ncbi:UNVERIFIED_CONTAM: hypothetical protein Sradi_6199200 [Sesamum radiatum]|uniref:Uncharacterized protein n=1 Tax=Sesamum radiatum TaxID=300843 RepID=A0AAW2KB72_SESRA